MMSGMNTSAKLTPAEGRITTEQRGHVLLIGIDRPAKRNGFTPAMLRALAEAYTRLDDDPALRVGLLHAHGDHFTAGLDLALLKADWPHPYTREQAAWPAAWLRDAKFWPTVGRIDNTYGDRHLVCSCPPIEAYEQPSTSH